MEFLFSLNSVVNSDLTWTHLVSKPDLTLCDVIYSPCLSYIVRIFVCFPVEIICLCCSETCLGTATLSTHTLWDMSGDIHAIHMYPLVIWRSLYSGACECFSEGVVSSPELWLVTGDKLVWLQVSFEWEGRGLFPLVLCDTWRHVRGPGSNWIQYYRKNYFQECFNRWLLHNHSCTCLHINCWRMHHRTHTLFEPLSLSPYWNRVSCFCHSVHSKLAGPQPSGWFSCLCLPSFQRRAGL